MTTSSRRTSRKLLAAALALCLVGVAAVVFLPIGWFLNRLVVRVYYLLLGLGLPVTIFGVDLALNATLFAMPVILAAMIWPKVRWWVWPVASFLCAVVIELAQFIALPRNAEWWDITANTVGGLLGSGLVSLARAALRRRVVAGQGRDTW
jgi:VanZ like family.